MINALCIPYDTTLPVRVESIDNTHLPTYRRLVGNQSIELLVLHDMSLTFYTAAGAKFASIPKNLRASHLLAVRTSGWRGKDFICGDTFIVGKPDDDGFDTNVPVELVQHIFCTERYRVDVRDRHRWLPSGFQYSDVWEAYAVAYKAYADRYPKVAAIRVVDATIP